MPASYTSEQPSHPLNLDICSTQRSLVHRVQMHAGSNRDTVCTLRITTRQFFWQQQHTCGALGGSPTECAVGGQPHNTRIFIPDTVTHPTEWPSQEEPGSGLTASALVSDVSTPTCTHGVWPPLPSVSVAQKNQPSTMLSSNVQSIDHLMDCTAWRFWTMRQSNGCSTPAPRSRAAKQWFEELAQKMKKNL